jgi:hypothetical protein
MSLFKPPSALKKDERGKTVNNHVLSPGTHLLVIALTMFGGTPGYADSTFRQAAAGRILALSSRTGYASIAATPTFIDNAAVSQMRFSDFSAMTPLGPATMVINTSDSGPGSLRQAIADANGNAGPDSIAFAIPKTDPGYNPLTGVWTIRPLSKLPDIVNDGTQINGLSQQGFAGDTNPGGPEIEIDGSLAGTYADGLVLHSSWNLIRGLTINRFGSNGIKILGPAVSANIIVNCHLGVTPSAAAGAGNAESGVWIFEASWNFIGFPDTALGNIIGGNGMAGVTIAGPTSQFNVVSVNCIGTDQKHEIDLGNQGDGVLFTDNACDNAISGFAFPLHVVIHNNRGAGIHVKGSGTVRNLLAAGSITRNRGLGILLEQDGNANMPAPTIKEADTHHVGGTAYPKSMIFLYRDPSGQGEEYFATAYADLYGNFSWTGPVKGPNVTAVAVDTLSGISVNNTSMFSAPFPLNGVYLVTTTHDAGMGSLRQALMSTNIHTGADTIRFAIPATDPGYSALTGVWTIKPASELPYINDGPLVVDGFSQAKFAGLETNPLGPEIELDGSSVTANSGFSIGVAGVDVLGLAINRFGRHGIVFSSVDGGRVAGCYVGTDPRGDLPAPNTGGILLYREARHIVIGSDGPMYPGNIISGNSTSGVNVMDSCSNNAIQGNIIGLDRTGTRKLGNIYGGVEITQNSYDNVVRKNRIGGNGQGVTLYQQSRGNLVEGNWIGCDTSRATDLGDVTHGVAIIESPDNTVRSNAIAFNGSSGVRVEGSSALRNVITRNSIWANVSSGIDNAGGGNAELVPPSGISLAGLTVSGKSATGDSVELFCDMQGQGKTFLGATKADLSGNWTVTLGSLPPLPHLTATARDKNGSTSEFSAPFVFTDVPVMQVVGIPKEYSLDQNYPNPFNPATLISFGIPARCFVNLQVFDLLGREVATVVREEMPAGYYSFSFPGFDRNLLIPGSGVYFYRLTVNAADGDPGVAFTRVRKMTLVR